MTEHYAASLTLQDIDALELPLIVLDRSGLIILANNPFLRSFALTAPQLDGLHWTDIVAAGNARRYAFSTLVSSVDQYGQAAFSCSVRTADGRVAEAQAMARALSSFAGAPVVVIIRLREERDMVSAKRRVSADTYKTLVMFSSIGILQVDECFKVRFANPAICSLLGYERPATLIGKDFSSLIAEPDRASFDAIMAKRRLGAAHTYRMRLVKANGETFKAELNEIGRASCRERV